LGCAPLAGLNHGKGEGAGSEKTEEAQSHHHYEL
jgi:hypothetical protein